MMQSMGIPFLFDTTQVHRVSAPTFIACLLTMGVQLTICSYHRVWQWALAWTLAHQPTCMAQRC